MQHKGARSKMQEADYSKVFFAIARAPFNYSLIVKQLNTGA
jgi:hypothetical protein